MDRNWLNDRLLSEASQTNNVYIVFEHKLVRCDVAKGILTFLYRGREKEVEADIIVGADGVFSRVRTGLMRAVRYISPLPSFLRTCFLISFPKRRMDFSQTYIDSLWCELEIPASDTPTPWNGYKMIPERLHIWPRGNFMLIALPNNVYPRLRPTYLNKPHKICPAISS